MWSNNEDCHTPLTDLDQVGKSTNWFGPLKTRASYIFFNTMEPYSSIWPIRPYDSGAYTEHTQTLLNEVFSSSKGHQRFCCSQILNLSTPNLSKFFHSYLFWSSFCNFGMKIKLYINQIQTCKTNIMLSKNIFASSYQNTTAYRLEF